MIRKLQTFPHWTIHLLLAVLVIVFAWLWYSEAQQSVEHLRDIATMSLNETEISFLRLRQYEELHGNDDRFYRGLEVSLMLDVGTAYPELQAVLLTDPDYLPLLREIDAYCETNQIWRDRGSIPSHRGARHVLRRVLDD